MNKRDGYHMLDFAQMSNCFNRCSLSFLSREVKPFDEPTSLIYSQPSSSSLESSSFGVMTHTSFLVSMPGSPTDRSTHALKLAVPEDCTIGKWHPLSRCRTELEAMLLSRVELSKSECSTIFVPPYPKVVVFELGARFSCCVPPQIPRMFRWRQWSNVSQERDILDTSLSLTFGPRCGSLILSLPIPQLFPLLSHVFFPTRSAVHDQTLISTFLVLLCQLESLAVHERLPALV